MPTSSREAYELLHQGAIALAEVEANGIRIDVPYLEKTIADLRETIADEEAVLKRDPVWARWEKAYGGRAKLYSLEQLGHLLFGVMGYECKDRTATGRAKADERVFERIDLPFVKRHVRLRKLKKVMTTNLEGVLRETVDGVLHPVFNLHFVRSFRSSSDSPNFQNFPVRDPSLSEIVRRAFIPREGRYLVEVDYGGIEVRVSACYHKDPTMVRYIKDPTTDMHRDMAMECYLLRQDQVSKKARYAAKNMFVFPQFYGSFYVDCARALWEATSRLKLATEGDGVPLREHLKARGVTSLGACDPDRPPKPGTFEHHLKQVEDRFWGERFPVYKQWKKDWYARYLKTGGFRTLTGFYIAGVYRRNEVINLPVQGSAFHCLLQSLIWLQRWLRKHRMTSLVVGQIHDSLVLDVAAAELADVLAACHRIMTRWVPRAWDWVVVPLEVEAEVAPCHRSWFHKHPVKDILCPTDGASLTWDLEEAEGKGKWVWR